VPTERQSEHILRHYEELLIKFFPMATSARRSSSLVPLIAAVEHLRWMIDEIRVQLQNGNTIKANRWIGYVEGSLVQLGLVTLEEVQMLDVETAFHS
jgi:hypothetical protein